MWTLPAAGVPWELGVAAGCLGGVTTDDDESDVVPPAPPPDDEDDAEPSLSLTPSRARLISAAAVAVPRCRCGSLPPLWSVDGIADEADNPKDVPGDGDTVDAMAPRGEGEPRHSGVE